MPASPAPVQTPHDSRRPKTAPLIPPRPGLQVLADDVVWDGRFPLQRVRFRYTRFDGTPSPDLTWELWRRGGGVAILPYDPHADTIALIEQFRLPAHAAGMTAIQTECAAGLLERGEDPLAAAQREIVEETGLNPDRYAPIGRFMLMQGGCDEVMHYYAARAALPAPGTTRTGGLVAEGEDIRLRILPADAAFALVDDGGIENATAAVCLLWLARHRDRLRREWQ